MKIELHQSGELIIAEVISDSVIVNDAQEALELIANCAYLDSMKIIISEKNLSPEFFDLKTKVAGEILQKFSTYNAQLAIVGDFNKFNSNSLRDFIYESNKGNRVYFVSSLEEAKEKLSGNT